MREAPWKGIRSGGAYDWRTRQAAHRLVERSMGSRSTECGGAIPGGRDNPARFGDNALSRRPATPPLIPRVLHAES